MGEDKLYDLMDWAQIEALTYSEEDNPHAILGPHLTDDGVLIQAFIPTAERIIVQITGKKESYEMTMEDEAGFFAVLIPGKQIPKYTLYVIFDNGTSLEYIDPYAFEPVLTKQETARFNAGICYDIYEKMGAHPMTVQGVKGVHFAVWAPNAVRVSLVGDFNLWDGRRLPMRRLWDSGIFELFVPGISVGEMYKYEIKAQGNITYLKADPYANAAQLRPETASIVADLTQFQWTDDAWMKQRKKTDSKKQPMAIYEMHLASWKKPENRDFYNYRELAPMIAEYVKEMGYTHIELLPVMEHPFDGSWGYQVTGYYAPTARYGTPEDFMYFMNYMHEAGIGVILDWVPAHFPRDTFGLAAFDGTCLYEHLDPRQGSHPHWGTLIYNYGRPEVKNFLISNALFWADKYHADGIRMDAVASMLYLDYGKNDGEWVANMYGGNENLEAVEFLKHLNSVFKKRRDGAILIAEESTAWPKITGALDDGGLGFDYKWNMGWMNDFIGYMSLDPIYRAGNHGGLTFSMIYAYSEDFILTLSHDEVVHGKCSLINKMPGDLTQKFANLRAAYGYMMAHPGKKLLFMGQEFAQYKEWNEAKGLDWEDLEQEPNRQMQAYYKALLEFYRSHPALYEMDYEPEGFTWINAINANENLLVFTRNTAKKDETLLIVCNFSPLVYADHKVGVPYPGKYKEIFNSDRAEFGGEGNVNPRVKQSKKEEADGQENSITVKIPPMGISIFSYAKAEPKAASNKAAKEKKAAGTKKTAKAAPEKVSLKDELMRKMEAAERPEKVSEKPEKKEPEKVSEKPQKKGLEKASEKPEKKEPEKVSEKTAKKETKKDSAKKTVKKKG
ncbi:MAG: 1,4-alpha-glucan branching protein GlgB [Marvinbryantia sp.]|uniref:1,4-alpha-glucan branching protein GlgB n=1 Tax=Marvinbryantia sp. TaxID=2496532 RepID=UPI003999C4BA